LERDTGYAVSIHSAACGFDSAAISYRAGSNVTLA
jgi:hypothetical protein